MPKRTYLLPIVFFATLLVFSFHPPTFAYAAVTDACSVISSADAQAVLGEPVGPAKSTPQATGFGDGSVCEYRSSAGSGLHGKRLSVTITNSRSDLTGKETGIADQEKSFGYKNVHMVPGVGSAAVWGTLSFPGRPQGELTVLKGKYVMLIILVTGIEEGAALDRSKVLASRILPKT